MGYLLRWRLSASRTCSDKVKLRCCCGKIQKWLSKIYLLHLASSFDLGVIMVIGVICVTFWVAYRVIIAQSSAWATRHVGTTCASNQTTGFDSTSLWISIRVKWGFDQGHLDWIKAAVNWISQCRICSFLKKDSLHLHMHHCFDRTLVLRARSPLHHGGRRQNKGEGVRGNFRNYCSFCVTIHNWELKLK